MAELQSTNIYGDLNITGKAASNGKAFVTETEDGTIEGTKSFEELVLPTTPSLANGSIWVEPDE